MKLGSGALLVVVVGGSLAAGLRSLPTQDRFDHAEHTGLFVTCVSCHAGIGADDEAGFVTVTPADCARCHDGVSEDRVEWSGPESRPTNLVFLHAGHDSVVSRAGDEALGCATCHRAEGEGFMDVGAATGESCLGCHAHEAPMHLADAECSECHVPLTASALGLARISNLPEPPDHDVALFLREHGLDSGGVAGEACTVCHARESCTRCHLDAAREPLIMALEPDERVASLLRGVAGEWPEPEDHDSGAFLFAHGESGVETCATCHAAASCTTCHLDRSAAWLAQLPRPGPGAPRGVELDGATPPAHVANFAFDHAAAAGAALPRCESCHAPAECADCHARLTGTPPRAGEAGSDDRLEDGLAPLDPAGLRHIEPGYHIRNFVTRHGAEAFGIQANCSDCHSTEVFCRDCHERSGIGGTRGAGATGAFHDARGSWLIGHGASARMGLEACASCHQQTSCLRCHSATSGLRVNPHGPGFQADRLAARSTISCGICHRADQIPRP